MQTLNFGHVPGLTQEEQKQLQDLAAAYNYYQSRNATKDKYYEGHISLRDVNLGIALPQGLRNLEVGCSWGQKAAAVLPLSGLAHGQNSKSAWLSFQPIFILRVGSRRLVLAPQSASAQASTGRLSSPPKP